MRHFIWKIAYDTTFDWSFKKMRHSIRKIAYDTTFARRFETLHLLDHLEHFIL